MCPQIYLSLSSSFVLPKYPSIILYICLLKLNMSKNNYWFLPPFHLTNDTNVLFTILSLNLWTILKVHIFKTYHKYVYSSLSPLIPSGHTIMISCLNCDPSFPTFPLASTTSIPHNSLSMQECFIKRPFSKVRQIMSFALVFQSSLYFHFSMVFQCILNQPQILTVANKDSEIWLYHFSDSCLPTLATLPPLYFTISIPLFVFYFTQDIFSCFFSSLLVSFD